MAVEFAGDLEGIRKAADLVGKEVHNKRYLENGKECTATVVKWRSDGVVAWLGRDPGRPVFLQFSVRVCCTIVLV